MVVHYPRTVWKNSYAEHEVTGKTYNLKKKKKNDLERFDFGESAGLTLKISEVLTKHYDFPNFLHYSGSFQESFVHLFKVGGVGQCSSPIYTLPLDLSLNISYST